MHEGAVEAALQMHYGEDYRNRWRFDPQGRRILTLRRIANLLSHVPPDSPLATALGEPGWTTSDYLMSDLFHAQTGKEHPARPKPSKARTVAQTPERRKKLADARRRRAARQAAIERGEIPPG